MVSAGTRGADERAAVNAARSRPPRVRPGMIDLARPEAGMRLPELVACCLAGAALWALIIWALLRLAQLLRPVLAAFGPGT